MSFEGIPLLAMSIDKEEMLRLVCTFKGRRGRLLDTWYFISGRMQGRVTWPVCLSFAFGGRLINISQAALAASLLELSHVNRSHPCDTTPLLLLRAVCGRAVSVRAQYKHGKLLEMESVGDTRQQLELTYATTHSRNTRKNQRNQTKQPFKSPQ